jgi:solute carrier family 25 (mitochondrial folate transporter), member 32
MAVAAASQVSVAKESIAASIYLSQQAIAGSVAGVTNVILCAPLDLARTRQQLQGLHCIKYRGIAGSLSLILKEEGVKGWFQGLRVSLIACPLNWAIYFPIYNHVRNSSRTYYGDIYSSMIGAASAGLISAFISNPLWLLRVRMQGQDMFADHKYNTIFSSLRRIVREEGVKSLFQGYSASILGLIHVIVQFPLYEIVKQAMLDPNQPPSLLQMLVCSTLPKIFASLVSYPHELLRARLFYQNKSQDKRFSSLRELVALSYRREGFRGFYAGFVTNLVRILPSSFVTLYTYERVAYWLKD